jgi:hypothetical protein
VIISGGDAAGHMGATERCISGKSTRRTTETTLMICALAIGPEQQRTRDSAASIAAWAPDQDRDGGLPLSRRARR